MTDKPEPQTTMTFSKTDWDDLHVMVELYKTRMKRVLRENNHDTAQPDAAEIIERRIHLAERIMRASQK